MAVSMDARYHGARIAGGAHGKKEYEAAIIRAWQTKTDDKQDYPFYYDTAGDTYHLVDYLCQRPDVDSSRIGMTGISMGGIETYMEAAVDKRVKVAVPVIAAQSFKWSLENNRWKGRVATIQEAHSEVARALGDSSVNPKNITALWNKVVPGITGEFDCPSLIRALAPRPLLLLSAESDQNCPLPGAKIAFDAAREAYATSGASDKLKIDVAPNEPHRFTPAHLEQLIAWFEKWL
jgi:fermentation-respiration switch protein FrsA (DUF1100 family)